MSSSTMRLYRRLVATGYKARDALRAAWNSTSTRPRLLALAWAFGIVLTAQLSGLCDALDAQFRARLYPLDAFGGDVGAVVVSIDSPDDLGARHELLRLIHAGRPRAVVTLGSLGDPPRRLGLARRGGVLERAECVGALRIGLDQLGLPCTDGALLRSAAPGDGTTVLAARSVLSGEVPSAAFQDAVVVVGESHGGPLLATPRGELSAPEALAQVLASAARRRPLVELPGAFDFGAAAVVVTLALFVLRLAKRRAWWTALLALACAFGTASLFVVGVAFGPTAPVLGTVVVALAFTAFEARAATERVGSVVLRLAAVGASAVDHGRYQAIARMASTRLRARGSAVFELPAGKWHVRLAGADGYSDADVLEVRRDCRRDPFREASRAGLAVVPRFFANTAEAVLVPLVADGVTVGFWALGFYGEVPDRAILERLGREFAAGLLHAEHEAAAGSDDRHFGSLPARLELLGAAGTNLASRLRRFHRMLESLPVPLLMTGPWGTVESANRAMRRFLGSIGADAGERVLPRLLASVAAVNAAEADLYVERALAGETVSVLVAAKHAAWSRLELSWSPGVDASPGSFALSAVHLDTQFRPREGTLPPKDDTSQSGLLPRFGERGEHDDRPTIPVGRRKAPDA